MRELRANDGSHTAFGIGGFSLVLVLVWAAAPAIFGKPERKKLAIARNLRVVSFWIAVTLVFVISVEFVFSNPLDRAIRLLAVLGALVAFVPVHMFRNFRGGLALLIPALWLSMGGGGASQSPGCARESRTGNPAGAGLRHRPGRG